MALKIVYGDIFDPKLDNLSRVVVHGCNAQGVMASGIAKTIRDKFPEVYTDYKSFEKSWQLRLGDVIYTTISDNLVVASAITQQCYGKDPSVVYVKYSAIQSALYEIATLFDDYEIHIPFIGGGLANGNRDTLLDIFKETLQNSDATLFIKD